MSSPKESGEMRALSRHGSKEGALGEEARVGNRRWIVCAMLFAATSINYMDRQVIAILKPTLESAIGLTEVHYAYVVDAFQVAYAIGLLAAGFIVDKLGTRIGYLIIMVTWSIAATGHAFASSAFEFGIARFFLGLGESGNFPAAIKTVAEWCQPGSDSRPANCSSDNHQVWLACGFCFHSIFQLAMDSLVVHLLSQTGPAFLDNPS
jgi:predicted MFS family arabinose efflux permease